MTIFPLYSSLFLLTASLCLYKPAYAKRNLTNHSHKQPFPALSSTAPPQLQIFEADAGNNKTYIIALDSNHSGATLITYNTPTCQANTHGTTIINPKDPSRLEFTAREDPYCKISMQKTKGDHLKIVRETPPCSTWHGDFCSFSSLSSLTLIYPKNTQQKTKTNIKQQQGHLSP